MNGATLPCFGLGVVLAAQGFPKAALWLFSIAAVFLFLPLGGVR